MAPDLFRGLVFGLALLGAACGGSTTHSSSDAGGSGGTGTGGSGGGGGESTCTSACATAASAHCPGQAQCVPSCTQSYTEFPGCAKQVDALIKCALSHGSWSCDASGQPTIDLPPDVCQSETMAFSNCVSTGGGGSG